MAETTTIRITRATHREVTQLAQQSGRTVADTVAHAVHLLRQDEIGRTLASPLTADETAWLDADAG